MVELFLVACLLARPQQCEQIYVPFQRPMTMAACLRQGQVSAFAWRREHPGWLVTRWTCTPPEA
jgi:hypothetical protein